MKKPKLLLLATVGLLLACAGSGYVGWSNGIHSHAITREAAIGITLARLGPGTPRNARLDRSDGMPVWELNFEQPGKPGVTEVRIHALTGEIIGLHAESLRKSNRELADVARHLGITAELLAPKTTMLADESAPPVPGLPDVGDNK